MLRTHFVILTTSLTGEFGAECQVGHTLSGKFATYPRNIESRFTCCVTDGVTNEKFRRNPSMGNMKRCTASELHCKAERSGHGRASMPGGNPGSREALHNR